MTAPIVQPSSGRPVRHVNVKLDYKPRPWQAYCHQHFKRFNVLVLHRRAGKSEIAMMELISHAVACKRELPMFGYIAPQLKQARAVMWERFKHKLEPLHKEGGCEFSESEPSIRFPQNNAKIRLFGAEDPDSLRGPWFDGVVFDETAQVKSSVWSEIVSPMLSDRNGWATFIGTPKGINLFSQLYYDGLNDPDWFCKKWTCYETDALPEAEIVRNRDNAMSPRTFAREMLCDFESLSDDQLISLSLATEATKRSYNPNDPLITSSPMIFGVDPARFGDDRSVLMRRQGLVCYPPDVWRGIDNMELAARVANQINRYQPAAVFIDAGAGAGVIDRLRQLGHNVIEVPFGGKALTPGFVNRRTEMWWRIREWLERGGCLPNDQALVKELATPVYWFDNKDQKVLEPKDSIRQRMDGEDKSPDVADALGLCFAADVATTLSHEDERLTPQQRQDRRYRPFDRNNPRR